MGTRAVVSSIAQLPPIPAHVAAVLEVTSDPEVTVAEVSRVVASDPALAAKIVQVANSAAYGRLDRAMNLWEAVSVLGINMCRATAVSMFLNELPLEIPQTARSQLHERSILTAYAARRFAADCGQDQPAAFLAGLLAYAGELICAVLDPVAMTRLMERPDWALPRAQREVLGYEARQTGTDALRSWGIPEVLCEAIEDREGMGHDRSLLMSVLAQATAVAANVANGGTQTIEMDAISAEQLLGDLWRSVPRHDHTTTDLRRAVAKVRAGIVLRALALEDRLRGDEEEQIDPVTGLPDRDMAIRYAHTLSEIAAPTDIGVVLFSLDGARDVDANRRTVAAQLAPMTRDDELLAVLDDTTIVLIVGAATEEALSATAARFRGLAYLVATEHGPMPIDVSWAINHL